MNEEDMRLNIKFLMMIVLVVAPGCIKYYDLAKSEFPQGEKQPDQREVAQRYRRVARVYDEFETKAIFYGLWLSDEVRKSYVDVYSSKRGLSDEAREEMLKRQLEENKHWISFYVLADVRDKTYTALNDKNAAWTLYADVDGKKIVPDKDGIRVLDYLEPELQLFFGKAVFDLFKTGYLIKFLVDPSLADQLTKGSVKQVKIDIHSTTKNCALVWQKEELESKRKVTSDEDFYWG